MSAASSQGGGVDLMASKESDIQKVKRSLEIVHEGVNFDFCRKVTLCAIGGGLYRVKMEAFITPKRKKEDY